MTEVVYFARCRVHGLHGQRTRCFECGAEVEQVPMVALAEHGQVVAERDFLLARLLPAHRLDGTQVGRSSNGMVIEALTGVEPDFWPLDEGDLGRCERTFELAPAHLQERMRARLAQFRDHVRGAEAR